MKLFELTNGSELSTEHTNVSNTNWTKIKSGFHKELTEIYAWIMSTQTRRTLYRDPSVGEKITNCIFKHTGIKSVVDKEYKMFAMMPPDLNKNHPLFGELHRNSHEFSNKEVKKSVGNLKGSVDLKNYRVSGMFSNVVVKLYLDPDWIFSKMMTAEEFSAVTIHEVGHMFSYFALCAHTYSINMPLISMVNRISNVKSEEEITIILKEWNGRDEVLTKVDTKELAGKRKEIIVTALVTNHVQDTRSAMNHGEYDGVNAEFLADNFTARCGAGADVVTGLDKVYAYYGHRNRGGFATFCLYELLLIMDTITIALITAATAIWIVPLLITIPLLIFSLLGFSNSNDLTYDTITTRYKRIREDMVSMLKDKEIDKAVGLRIRNDIRRIDEVLKEYNEYKSLIGRVVDLIVPFLRRSVSQMEFYRELEELGNNDLFIGAYDLRTL